MGGEGRKNTYQVKKKKKGEWVSQGGFKYIYITP